MSRLRRLVLSDRYFFVTCNVRRSRRTLGEHDFARLASILARMREKHGFTLTAWVFLPDHWHAILYPRHPLAISALLKALKVSSMIAVNRGRGEAGELWQGRFFDHALRTVQEYLETVEYIHLEAKSRRPTEQVCATLLPVAKHGQDGRATREKAADLQNRSALPASETSISSTCPTLGC